MCVCHGIACMERLPGNPNTNLPKNMVNSPLLYLTTRPSKRRLPKFVFRISYCLKIKKASSMTFVNAKNIIDIPPFSNLMNLRFNFFVLNIEDSTLDNNTIYLRFITLI